MTTPTPPPRSTGATPVRPPAPSRWGWRLTRLLRLGLFVGLAVTAVVLPTWLALGARASAGPGLPPAPSVSAADLDRLRGEVTDLRAELKAADGRAAERADQSDKAAGEAARRADEAGGQADGLRTKVTDLQAKVNDLQAKVHDLTPTTGTADATELKALTKSVEDLKPLGKSVEDLKTAQAKQARQLDDLKIDDRLNAARSDVNKDLDKRFEGFKADRAKDLDGYNKALDDLKGRLDAVEKRQAQAPESEPTDVLVLGLHSHNLGLNLYFNALREVVDPRQRSAPAGCRVGFCLAEGDDYEPIFPLGPGDGKKGGEAFDRLGSAQEGSQDRLAGLGTKVQEQFRDSRAAHRRCVVVASASCEPAPAEQFDDWKGLAVEVILIGSDKKARELPASRLQEWQAFCRRCEGSLTLLSAAGDADAADPQVAAQLKNCLWQATQPVFPLKKKVTP